MAPPRQAVFLELDTSRTGSLTQHELLYWSRGHIGRGLKRLANSPPRRKRTLHSLLFSSGYAIGVANTFASAASRTSWQPAASHNWLNF